MEVKEYDKIILHWSPDELDEILRRKYKEYKVVQAVPVSWFCIIIILEREYVKRV